MIEAGEIREIQHTRDTQLLRALFLAASGRLSGSQSVLVSPTDPQTRGETRGYKTVGIPDFLSKRTKALTVTDVAELLNISERQVYKLAADHRIPCFKIGNSIRFDPAAFAAWLLQKMAPGSELPPGSRRKIRRTS